MKIESQYPTRSVEGFFIINRFTNAVYWGAWKQWLSTELGRTFFPENQNCLSALPPETQAEAEKVAAYVNKIRAMPDKARGKGGLINPRAVPATPAPWKRWTDEEMDAYEAKERAEWTDPPRRTPEQAAALIAATRKRHRYGKGYEVPFEECPPIPYEPTPPDLAKERAETLAARLHEPQASLYDQLRGE